MSLYQRGHLSNLFCFNYIKQIIIDDKGITFLKRFGEGYSSWENIKSANIYQSAAYKAYGAGSWGKIVKRTFSISTKDGSVFEFDVSRDFPDFNDSVQLEQVLNKYLNVKKHAVREFSIIPGLILVIVLVALSIWLKIKGL